MPHFPENNDKTREVNISISQVLLALVFPVWRPIRVGTDKVLAACSVKRIKNCASLAESISCLLDRCPLSF